MLTEEQKQEFLRTLLLTTDNFCSTQGIDVDNLNYAEWSTLREELAICYRQALYLIGANGD